MEPSAVHGRPVFPIRVGDAVKFPSLVKRRFVHPHRKCNVKGVEHVRHAALGFADLAVVVSLHGVDGLRHLLGGLILVAGEARFLHVVLRRRRPVQRVGLAVLTLHLGHVAGGAVGARLRVLTCPEGFHVRVLHLR